MPLLPLPEGWLLVDAARAASLVRELHSELIPGHLLYQGAVRAVAQRGANDDALFQHVADPARFTVVHLTYRSRPELNAQYPAVVFDGPWVEFIREEQRLVE